RPLVYRGTADTLLDIGRYSWDSRFLAYRGPVRTPEQNWLSQLVREWLNINPSPISTERVTVVDLHSGRSRTVPAFCCFGFGPNAETFWTLDIVEEDERGNVVPETLIFRQWSVHAPWPPWWLWVLTAGGVGMIGWDARCIWR